MISVADSVVAYAAVAALSLLVCRSAEPIGQRLGVIDRPDGRRKVHRRSTPLVGGIAIIGPVSGVLAVLAAATPFTTFHLTAAATTLALFAIGFADDKRHIAAVWRLLISFVVCLAAIVAVPAFRVDFLEFGFVPVALLLDDRTATVFSLLCLVGLQNAINMADGKNGLVIGMALIWDLILFAYAPPHLYPVLGALALTLAITLMFNMGDRLFLGDSGSYALSTLVGLLAIYCYEVKGGAFTADAVALMFLVPVVDCLRLAALRVVGGRSPFAPDHWHLHHMLESLMPWDRALALYLGLIAVPNLLALVLPRQTLMWAVITLALYAVIVVVGRRTVNARVESSA